MQILNESDYMFLDGSIVEPSTSQKDGVCFFEVKVPESYWDSDVETGKLHQQAQEWAVETACIHFGLNQEDYFPSFYPWEERLSIALIPVSGIPGYVKSDPSNWYFDFELEAWTKVN